MTKHFVILKKLSLCHRRRRQLLLLLSPRPLSKLLSSHMSQRPSCMKSLKSSNPMFTRRGNGLKLTFLSRHGSLSVN